MSYDEQKIISLLEDALAEAESNGVDAGMGYVFLALEEWGFDTAGQPQQTPQQQGGSDG